MQLSTPTRRITSTVAIAAALTMGAGAASAAPVGAGDTTSAAAPAHASASAGRTDVARTSYLAATHSGGTAYLRLVDRATGAVTRTITSAPMHRDSPFGDATVAPDGAVWAVVGDSTFRTRLVRITGGRTTTVLPYATDVALSPDGRRVAVTVVSPDADGDGQGTASVRVGPADLSSPPRTIGQTTFPVGTDGKPSAEIAAPRVDTWLGNDRLVVSRGCCGDNAVTVLPASGRTDLLRAPSAETPSPVARYGDDAVLTVRDVYRAPDAPQGAEQLVGHDLVRVSAAEPRGTTVGHVPHGPGWEAGVASYLRRTHATVLDPQNAGLPYRGPGSVDRTFVAG